MPIRKLPEADIRSICASQALSSPVFVVKELVENALDAGAKSITIEIAANTIDVIRVTDDGYGVPPEDRELLAQRHCTSKLSSFLELESLGGRSYGFRGAALASLAELSASLYITTKVEGEVVATTYHLNPDGSIAGTKVASHAVGTTVRAVDLLDRLPVRREQMVKQADRTIAAITGLLGAYAFCRSETRVRFKVLKEQNSKRSWCYTPEPMATLKQIASQIIGAEAASQLQESQAELPLLEEGDNLDPDHPVEHISVRMLSILGHSDPSKAKARAQFMSVDGRPMNNERRLFREIISYYKNMVRASRPADTQSVLRNLPLCLQISCPEGIYDPNVEPDKDDVLFADEKIVQATLQRFIRTTYRITASDLEATQCTPAHANQASLEDLGDMSDHRGTQGAYTRPLKTRAIFSPLSSNRGDFDTIERGGDHLQIYVRPEAKIIDEPPLRHTAIDDGPVGDSSSMVNTLSSEPFSDSISSTQAELNNPWITAKINASIRERPGSPSIRGLHMPMQPALSAANKGPSILSMLQKSRRGPLPTPDPSSSPNGRDLDRLIIPGSTRIHQPGSSSPIPLSSSPPSMLRQPGFGAQVRARYTRSVGMRNPERFSYFEREIIRPESLPSATGCVEEDDHRLARFDSHDINDDEQVETERRTVRTTKLPSFRSRHSAALNTSSHPHSESSPSPSDVQSAGGMEVQANDIGELATRSSHSQLEGRVQLQLAKQQDLQNANIIQILNPNTQGNQSIGISLRYGNAGDPRLTLLGINGHTLGKRRLTRAITATLPLEKVPENQQLQSVVLQVNIAVSAILEANQRVSMAISPPRITETIESSVPSDLEILWQVLHERDELIRCIKRLSSDRIDDTEYVWSEGRTGQAI